MKRTIFLTTVVVSSITVFSCFAPNPAKEIKNKVYLDPSIKVLNFTANKNLEQVVNTTAQVLKLKNITVVCVPIVDEEERFLLGYIVPEDGFYLIKIQPGLYDDLLLEVCVHEFWHLKDYESGDLERLEYGFKYKEFTYSFNTFYWDRPFELSAYQNELRLKIEVSHKMNNPHCLN